ncbi:MAG: aspartate-semialdehyde dehydrogenase [Spirochaetia bacterium]|nr:aspartate-semialdehyde dehydrogenase [Spirochaetia bacterium]
MEKISVAVLGATGTVGQKFISLLENHPFFEVTEVVASSRSAGKKYKDAVSWKQDRFIPENVADLVVKTTDDSLDSRILFSGMDAEVAGPAEEEYARRGHFVISNSKNHRMDKDVPIIIPEVNPEHFELIKVQPYKGAIITNSNCSTMFLAMVLAPLHRAFGVEKVFVSTMQAISGAGYPGVASMDILGNVIPFIGGEEPKMECEAQKILADLKNGELVPAPFVVSAHCNRVPVFDGHTESVSILFKNKPTVEQVKETLRNFKGIPQEKQLPFAPKQPILVFEEDNRPQPARDVWKENGMAACVGRIRECSIFDIKMTVMGHNTVRGAAGAAILNAETLVALGYLN